MRLKIIVTLSLVYLSYLVSGQTLGTYPSGSVATGGSATITPAFSPSNTSRISVKASDGFAGVLTAKVSNGKVTVTNAKPAGVYTITVRAFNASGSSTTRTFPLTVTKPVCSDGILTGTLNMGGLQNNLTGIAVGDFNDDGDQDLVIAHEGFNTVSVRLGNGSGGFTGNTEVVVTSHPYSVAVGDIDLDGKQDFLATCQGNGIVAVRAGDGMGGFGAYSNVNVGLNPVSIALGDFNNDGKPDFATANFNDHTVSIRIGDGAGSFTGNLAVPVGNYPAGVALGDFNNDNKLDLAAASSAQNTVSIRLGNGFGGFSGNTEVAVGTNPNSVALADFNGDGNLDLAAANYLSNTVSIRLGDGMGGFGNGTEVSVGSGPYYVAVGNFNGDDITDLATANYFGNTVSIRLGDGAGGFSGSTDVSVGSYPFCIGVGDFNGDRRHDVAVTNYQDHTVSVRLGVNGFVPQLAATSNSPVCVGQTLQLNSYPDYTYYWNGPNGFSATSENPSIAVTSLSHAGIYNVSIVNKSNCSALASTSVSILPLPAVSFSLPTDTICSGSPVIPLSGGVPAGGFYSGQGVAPGPVFDPGLTGPGDFYTLYTYTDSNGCVNSDTGKVHVLVCAGFEETETSAAYAIFPDPVTKELRFQLPSMSTQCRIELFSPDGRRLKTERYSNVTNGSLSAENLPGGIYLVRITTEEKMVLKKIFIGF
jgi:hypothetical protein